MVPSAIDSPIWGITTSVAMITPLQDLQRRGLRFPILVCAEARPGQRNPGAAQSALQHDFLLDLRRRGCSVTFRGRRIDYGFDFRNTVSWKAALLRVGANHVFAGGDIDAINLVAGYVALYPLNLRPEVLQDRARLLRDTLQFLRRQISGARNFSFDYILRHCETPSRKQLDRSI